MNGTAVDFSVLDNVQPGSQITVRFKPEAVDDMIYVYTMVNAGVIGMKPGEMMVMLAVRESGDWDGDRNRTMTFTADSGWDRSFFEGRMRRAIESLEIK